jgi:3-deoxy-D-manno-octulosonic-acid transferase
MLLYNLLLALIYPLLWLLSRFHQRLRMNFTLREVLPDFAKAHTKRHIWFHASSAGEFEQVRALAVEMRKLNEDFYFSFSFFSDSAYRARKNDSIPDVLFALPFDFSWRMRRLVRIMKPDALIIGKYDAWPNQVLACVHASVPVYLVSATLPEKSRRHRFPLRGFLSKVYAPMQRIFAINADHAVRLKKISPTNVIVSGDTRFDAIRFRLLEGASHAARIALVKREMSSRRILVCGSTYTASEKMILEFVGNQRSTGRMRFSAIIAPHHVRPNRIAEIESECQRLGLRTAKWTEKNKHPYDVLIVDALGVLPYLYALADVAYIGGGFEGSVHSVIEAAISGAPIVTGPAIINSAEALELRKLHLLEIIRKADAATFSVIVENLCKTRAVISKGLKSYFGQRVGVSREIVHTVMDDLYKR